MDQKAARSGSEVVDWLIEQIYETTFIERLNFIAEVIKQDTEVKERYTQDASDMERLRNAWGAKKQQIENG